MLTTLKYLELTCMFTCLILFFFIVFDIKVSCMPFFAAGDRFIRAFLDEQNL